MNGRSRIKKDKSVRGGDEISFQVANLPVSVGTKRMIKERPLIITKLLKNHTNLPYSKKGDGSVGWFPRTRVPQYRILRESA